MGRLIINEGEGFKRQKTEVLTALPTNDSNF